MVGGALGKSAKVPRVGWREVGPFLFAHAFLFPTPIIFFHVGDVATKMIIKFGRATLGPRKTTTSMLGEPIEQTNLKDTSEVYNVGPLGHVQGHGHFNQT